jgi:WD40 repeat protein/serine/threonine protein kinase
MPEREAQTLTHGIKKTSQDILTLTEGMEIDSSDTTMNRTIGGGTGELVDKVDWEIGDIIDGRFEVTAIIGRGGMGVVYKVRHLEWKINLAVKIPLAHLVADQASKARFIREAQTWVDLGMHPNIVQCWYVRELGGIPRMFMDYVSGGSLKDWIKEGKITPGEWDKILDLMIQACDGLGYAHQHGVVHRDVKPANFLLSGWNELFVTDFGIVKLENIGDIKGKTEGNSSGDKQDALTVAGTELGTPQYAAPEQWVRKRRVDTRADIYALGIVLFELCCGRRPFDDGSHSEPPQVLVGRHISSPAPDPREFNKDIPKSLAEVTLRCLEKDPKKRPQSMTALRETLVSVYKEVIEKSYRRPVPQATELRSDALNNQAVSLLDLGKEEESLEVWKKALMLDPYHPESIYNSALLEWIEGTITDDEVVKRLEEVKHTSRRFSLYLGLVHLERAAADEAERELDNATKDPKLAMSSMLWQALGDARMAQEKYVEAETAYQRALQLIPGDFGSLQRQTLAQVKTRQQEDQIIFPWQHCSRIFEGRHDSDITAAVVTPDGQYILSGSRDSTMRLWDISTTDSLQTYERYKKEITAIAVTPDGGFIVSGCDDGSLWLWDLKTAKHLRIFEGHRDAVTAVAVTPEGRFVVSGSRDNTLRLWNLETAKTLRLFKGHTEAVSAVTVTPNGRFIVSASHDRTLCLWDLVTTKCLRTFKGHVDAVTAVAVTSNGRFILSGSDDKTLCLWDRATAECLQTFRGHKDRITSVAITPDGHFATSGSSDRTLRLWKLSMKKCLRTFKGHEEGITSVAITLDGRFAVSGSKDKTLRLWALETGTHHHEATIQVCRQRNLGDLQSSTERFRKWMALAKAAWKDGKAVTAYKYLYRAREVSGYERAPESLELNAAIGTILPKKNLQGQWLLRTLEGHKGGVTAVAMTPDGRFVVSGSKDKTLRLWDLTTKKCLRTFEGHKKDVTAVAITPDGRFVVSGSTDSTLRLWDLSTAKCLRTYKGHKLGITAVTVPPYGQVIVSGSKDKTLRLWNPATAECLQIFKGQKSSITTVAATPDRRFVISGCIGKDLWVWDMETAECLSTLEGHRKSVTSLKIAQNGQLAISGSKDNTLRLWEIASGKCLKTFKDHKDWVLSVAMTPDTRFVLSGSNDTTLRFWNCLTGECIWIFEGHRQAVTAVTITPDGRFVVSGSEDKTLKLWELDWELDPNVTASPGIEERTKNTRLTNRLVSLFNSSKKK